MTARKYSGQTKTTRMLLGVWTTISLCPILFNTDLGPAFLGRTHERLRYGWGHSWPPSCHIPCPTRDRLPPPDPAGPRPGPPDPSPSIRTFCSTYFLLTHFLHVILGPHSGLRLPPDTRSTPLHHPVYPSALLTLFVFTCLHPLPCTRP